MTLTSATWPLVALLMLHLVVSDVTPCTIDHAPSPDGCSVNSTVTFTATRTQNSVFLSCRSLVSPLSPHCVITHMTWTYYGREVNATTDSRYEMSSPQEGTLKVSNPNKRYVGKYHVTYKLNSSSGGESELRCVVCLHATPLVLHNEQFTDERSRHFYEGENMDIGRQFEVLGHPVEEVQWFKDGVRLESSPRVHMSANWRGHPNGNLQIQAATREDEGEYECRAVGRNTVGRTVNHSKSHDFHVQSSLGFLLPLTMIGVEVLVFAVLYYINSCLNVLKSRQKENVVKQQRDKQQEQSDQGPQSSERVIESLTTSVVPSTEAGASRVSQGTSSKFGVIVKPSYWSLLSQQKSHKTLASGAHQSWHK